MPKKESHIDFAEEAFAEAADALGMVAQKLQEADEDELQQVDTETKLPKLYNQRRVEVDDG